LRSATGCFVSEAFDKVLLPNGTAAPIRCTRG
jgi:hypothetical protein